MKTIISVIFLSVCGFVANFAAVFILNFVGLFGPLIAGRSAKRVGWRYFLGTLVSILGQSYVYLSFIAFIVNWTRLAATRGDVWGFVLWPFAFFAAILPIWFTMGRALSEARADKTNNPQIEALPITFFISLISFFVFALFPAIISFGWDWVPYVD